MNFLPVLQETADTVGYMLLGYAFLIGLPILYILSWVVRRRNVQRDLEMIETLAAEEKKRREAAAARPAPVERPKPSAS
jgi:hypothetical protein